MSLVIRSAKESDLKDLYGLARQFTLLNLPADKRVLSEIIEESEMSFKGKMSPENSVYLFVAEDKETKRVVASSLIHGRCGTKESPNYAYKILKRNLFSQDLGIGFIHQVLQLKADSEGPTEIGGLLVDRSYRRRPEKLGKQISFARFSYIALHPDRFTDEIHVELAPPLTEEGRSEFWEALGRRFTGLPYQEADALSQQNKEFIRSLFPPEDIYLSLLDAQARLVLGRVGEETRPAQQMLENIGFKYIEEVDPFDGGPHYRAKLKNLKPVKNGKHVTVEVQKKGKFKDFGFIGTTVPGSFQGGLVHATLDGDKAIIAKDRAEALGLEAGVKGFYFDFGA